MTESHRATESLWISSIWWVTEYIILCQLQIICMCYYWKDIYILSIRDLYRVSSSRMVYFNQLVTRSILCLITCSCLLSSPVTPSKRDKLLCSLYSAIAFTYFLYLENRFPYRVHNIFINIYLSKCGIFLSILYHGLHVCAPWCEMLLTVWPFQESLHERMNGRNTILWWVEGLSTESTVPKLLVQH